MIVWINFVLKPQFESFNSFEERTNHIKDIVNTADNYFEELGVKIRLCGIEFWKDDKISLTGDISNVSSLQ